MPQDPHVLQHTSKLFENRHTLKRQMGGKSFCGKWRVWILLFGLTQQQNPARSQIYQGVYASSQIPQTIHCIQGPPLHNLAHRLLLFANNINKLTPSPMYTSILNTQIIQEFKIEQENDVIFQISTALD